MKPNKELAELVFRLGEEHGSQLVIARFNAEMSRRHGGECLARAIAEVERLEGMSVDDIIDRAKAAIKARTGEKA